MSFLVLMMSLPDTWITFLSAVLKEKGAVPQKLREKKDRPFS